MSSPFVNEALYHVYNRGVEKRTIFKSYGDYLRFMETLNFYRLHPTPRKLSTHIKFNFPPIPKNLIQKQVVKIICFCLMPNHFHLLIQQLDYFNGSSSSYKSIVEDTPDIQLPEKLPIDNDFDY